MALFDRFRGPAAAVTGDEIRRQLIQAAQRNDGRTFVSLLNTHSVLIRQAFRNWKTVPEDFREDPQKLNTYANMLITIASMFQKMGDASLMQLLQEGKWTWDDELKQADALIEGKRFEEAIALLGNTLRDVDTNKGSAVAHYRALVLGRLGIAHVRAGNFSAAREATEQALELCRGAGDEAGVKAYSANLASIGTVQLPSADATGSLRVAFRDGDGRLLRESELSTATRLKWEVSSDTTPSPEAKRLHDEGRAAGERGESDEAIRLFTKAAELEPSWPYPVYDRAFAYLQQGDFVSALTDYRRVLELSPRGFFTASLAVDSLSREATGEIPAGFYRAYSTVEHLPKEQQRNILRQTTEMFPSLAVGWSQYANFEQDPVKRLALIESGLAAGGDIDTQGQLAVRKAMTLAELGRKQEAHAILQPLVTSGTGSMSAQVNAYAAMTTLGL